MKQFISYSIRDGIITRNLLQKAKTLYNKYGSCYVDMLDNDSIDKQRRVIQELYKADILILLQTPASKSSKWVQKEIQIAHKRKIPIITVNNIHIELLLREL